MIASKPTILFVTDLYFEARGRAYNTKDIFLTSQLREDFKNIVRLPKAEAYVTKLKNGADSIGMRVVRPDELDQLVFNNRLVQPKINIRNNKVYA